MKKQRGYTVGQLVIVVAVISVVLGGGALLLGNVGLGFKGALKETVESTGYAVAASGNNLRTYEWKAKNGMDCVGVYTDKGGSWGNCAFKPAHIDR